MDQSIVLNITNAIIVLVAALSGATIGAILTYRFSLGQENRRKKREIIEELYGLAYKIQIEVDEYLSGGSFLEFPGAIPDSLLRMRVLTDLYFRSFIPRLKEFACIVSKLPNAKRSQYVPDEYGHSTIGNTDEFDQAKVAYSKSYTNLMETLQKLSKGSTDIT
jgi:hypothetical protein